MSTRYGRTVSAFLMGLALLIPGLAAVAQPRIPGVGFGLILGEPTGITLKGTVGGTNAWDGAIGTSWFGNLTIQGDYLWAADVFSSSKVGLYFGLGGVVGIGQGKGVVVKEKKGEWYYREENSSSAFGVRGVAGINAMPFHSPVEFFFELAPVVGLTPTTGVGWQGAIGLRYYP